MKNILLTIMLAVPLTVYAADETIMFEVGFGFGGSGKVTKSKAELDNKFNNKFCYHRPQSNSIYGAVRYRYDDVEVHAARWVSSADQARCERSSWAVGLGYVIDTQTGTGQENVDDVYASWTPGVAYTWGGNTDFNVQDNTNTNWRLKDNWQMYNRVAVGGGSKDYNAEVAIARYGLIAGDYERKGENFITENNSRGLEPPVTIINEGDIIEGDTINEITEVTNVTNEITEVTNEGDTYITEITIIDGNQGTGEGGNGAEQGEGGSATEGSGI